MERFDFEQQGIESWRPVDGRWEVEEMSGAPSGKRVLVQRATENAFNMIVAPPGPYTDVDVSVRCKPMAGQEDASGGLVFRFAAGHYYAVGALEDRKASHGDSLLRRTRDHGPHAGRTPGKASMGLSDNSLIRAVAPRRHHVTQ